MSCTSENSTSIISSKMELPSSASSSTSPSCSFAALSSFSPGGRALDRYNPIITDEKRRRSASTPTTPCDNIHPIKPTTPSPNPHQPQNSKKNRKLLGRKNKNAPKSTPVLSTTNDDDKDDDDDEKRKGASKASDFIMKAAVTVARPGMNYVSPPASSRYLLDDEDSSSFIDVLSEFDPVLKLVPEKPAENEIEVSDWKSGAPSSKPPLQESSTGSSDQVVVLRVSLHCRGCERKMKKHLSRMAGVTSFNIDFAAKKVTVVGDVTPLQVLASISKVKNAQLWTPAMASLNSRSIEAWK